MKKTKRVLLAAATVALLAIPTTASTASAESYGYGRTIIEATNGCTYGQLVVLAGGPQNHPIAGVGAKRLVEAVLANQHPVPDCGGDS